MNETIGEIAGISNSNDAVSPVVDSASDTDQQPIDTTNVREASAFKVGTKNLDDDEDIDLESMARFEFDKDGNILRKKADTEVAWINTENKIRTLEREIIKSHNPAEITQMRKELNELIQKENEMFAVFEKVDNKDIGGFNYNEFYTDRDIKIDEDTGNVTEASMKNSIEVYQNKQKDFDKKVAEITKQIEALAMRNGSLRSINNAINELEKLKDDPDIGDSVKTKIEELKKSRDEIRIVKLDANLGKIIDLSKRLEYLKMQVNPNSYIEPFRTRIKNSITRYERAIQMSPSKLSTNTSDLTQDKGRMAA